MAQHKRRRIFAMLAAINLFFCNSGIFSMTAAEENTEKQSMMQLLLILAR